jgi:hypothetical protein
LLRLLELNVMFHIILSKRTFEGLTGEPLVGRQLAKKHLPASNAKLSV